MVILEATNIHKIYGTKKNRQEVLKGIDLRVERGEFLAIMGPSGSGKTTLLNVLSSIDRVSEGAIFIGGANIAAMKDRELAEFRKRHVGFIFQEYYLLDTLTVKENVLLPLSITKTPKQEAERRFAELAAELGIDEIQHHYPSEISGGQKQRTAAARAFIHEPSIIFADEPTGALDSKSASDLLHKLQQLNQKRKATIIMVTHDPAAASFSSRVVFIKDGQLYTQLYKGEETQQQFFQAIMQTQGVLGGVRP
ncbi:ABC transporter ATP-binding protein [Geobacillus thermoleovorans]|uniref:ABC transporter ATP-binding protein n=1 Tax=Geobacillus thermoleovorans TaxID=33941 RepID=UPI00345BAD7E